MLSTYPIQLSNMARRRATPRGYTPGLLDRGLDNVLEEDLLGSVDHRQLQLLLGSKMSEDARFAHPQLSREPPDREPLESLSRGDIGGDAEDLLASSGGLIGVIKNRRFGCHSTVILYRTIVL
jgi:hypothetical protein